MASDRSDLVNRLRVLRAERGWTQAEVAERVGVTRKTINTVEGGIFVPSTVLALRLAEAFGVRVEDVFQLRETAEGRRVET
jgi:putative transcriptional regulator